MGQSQAVTVPYGNVHDSGGGHFLDEFGSERRGLGGTAAEAGTTAPRVHLNNTVGRMSTLQKKKKKEEKGGEVRAPSQPVPWRSRRGTTGFQHTLS